MFYHNHMDSESQLVRSDYMGSSKKIRNRSSESYESTRTKIFKKVDARDKRAPKKQFCSDESSKLEFLSFYFVTLAMFYWNELSLAKYSSR